MVLNIFFFFLGPSAYLKDQWVGYDDQESVYAKGEYILQSGYGGVTLWTVDLDDFLNRCCSESFPLLKSINRALGNTSHYIYSLNVASVNACPIMYIYIIGRLKNKASEGCQRPAEPITPQPPTLTTHSDAVEETPRPTTPMTKPTMWPTWTEKPSTSAQHTTWPTWTWKPDTTSSVSSTTISWTTQSTTKYYNLNFP